MQKVVGSNPISRFFAIALHVGGSGSARVSRNKIKPSPHIPSILGTSAPNTADVWGLVAMISPNFASRCASGGATVRADKQSAPGRDAPGWP
jgi:hypothetical protein